MKSKIRRVLPLTFCLFTLFYQCAVKNLQKMQTPFYGKQGILPALSRALHLESGIVGKRRPSAGDDYADFLNNFRLAFILFRGYFQID